MNYKIVLTKQAIKDAKKIKQHKKYLIKKVDALFEELKDDPYIGKHLLGELKDFYSLRLNIQHRIVYQVYEKEKVVKVVSMWEHY